jgi:hypothetical protein
MRNCASGNLEQQLLDSGPAPDSASRNDGAKPANLTSSRKNFACLSAGRTRDLLIVADYPDYLLKGASRIAPTGR